MLVTGLLGAILGWLTYELLYWVSPLARFRATASWGASWVVSVWRQHALHRWLTFQNRAPYPRSLSRAYGFYAVSGMLGALVNFRLTQMPGVHHRAAWLVCLGVTGLVSLLFLKRLVYRTEE